MTAFMPAACCFMISNVSAAASRLCMITGMSFSRGQIKLADEPSLSECHVSLCPSNNPARFLPTAMILSRSSSSDILENFSSSRLPASSGCTPIAPYTKGYRSVQPHDLIPGFDRGPHIYDQADPACFHILKQLLSVCVKTVHHHSVRVCRLS